MASFEKLPFGRWRAVTWDPYRKRKAKTKTFDFDPDRPDQAPVEAEAWAARVELDIWKAYKDNGIEVERKAKPITFAEYAASWSWPGPPSTRAVHRTNARALAKVWPTERSPTSPRGWSGRCCSTSQRPGSRSGRARPG